jgi:hypothetical protein
VFTAFFCCLPGQQGLVGQLGGDIVPFGTCGDGGIAYPSSKLASSVSPFPVLTTDQLLSLRIKQISQITGAATASGSLLTSTATNSLSTSLGAINTLVTSGTATQSNPSTSIGQPSTTTTASPSSSSSSSSAANLSTGAIAGIAVGAVALIAIIGICCYMCFRFGQRKGREAASTPAYNPEPTSFPPTGYQRKDMLEEYVSPLPPAEVEYRPDRNVSELGGYGSA